MPKFELKDLFLCESAIISMPNGQRSLINLVSDITSTSFPALHPKLTILVTVVGTPGKYNEKIYLIPLDVSGNEEKPLVDTEGQIELKENAGNNFIATFINIIFPKAGKYWVKVTIDGQTISEKSKHFIELKKV